MPTVVKVGEKKSLEIACRILAVRNISDGHFVFLYRFWRRSRPWPLPDPRRDTLTVHRFLPAVAAADTRPAVAAAAIRPAVVAADTRPVAAAADTRRAVALA